MMEIALHILDIAENCVNAGASHVQIFVREDEPDLLIISVQDDGKGMSPEELKRVRDPFYTSRTTRKVGLGIPLLNQQVQLTGGQFLISSEDGKGTRVEAGFVRSHPDRQPLGDLEGIWIMLVSSYQDVEWELECVSAKGNYAISSSEIKEVLGVEEIRDMELRKQLQRMIRNNIDGLGLA